MLAQFSQNTMNRYYLCFKAFVIRLKSNLRFGIICASMIIWPKVFRRVNRARLKLQTRVFQNEQKAPAATFLDF